MRRISLIRFVTLVTCAIGSFARLSANDFPELRNTEKAVDAPLPPDEVVKTANLPAGFELSVFAAEPDVQNPIAITTDERGRLWVAENYTWAGAGLGNFDDKLRDRVVILEDANGDGRHDKRTVFWDGATKLSSVEVGFGGVWLLCAPQMLFIPDKNRDDVPDGPPQVVLDGFDENAVSHTVVNGLKWGPDGWLYARHGILATSNIGKPGASDSQRVKINTGVWRYHPTRGTVEVVMHGMTNSWGFDFNEHGEMFVINTVIGHLWHVVPGARTQRMFGVDFNPHAYQLIPQTADHVHWDTGEVWDDIRKGVTDKTSAAGGGHAHIGLMIYQGDNWPAEYRGRVYTLNLHGRRINCDLLERRGAAYVAKHGPDMGFIADSWYRGMDLITGPDGGVFIADWSDTGECHDHDGVHRTSGRIYKLTHGTPRKLEPFDLDKLDDLALVQLQLHENDWQTRQARRILQERAAESEATRIAIRQPLFDLFTKQPKVVHKLRAMWALCITGGVDEAWLIEQLVHPDEHVRVWAVRFLSDKLDPQEHLPSVGVLNALRQVAQTDRSGLVLLYVASALQRMPHEARWPIARVLATRKEPDFTHDTVLPIMLWLGIEPAVPQDPAAALELAAHTTFPLVRQNIARRLTLEIERDLTTVDHLLTLAAKRTEIARDLLAGMSEALRGWRKAPLPAAWNQVSEQLNNNGNGNDNLRPLVRELGIVFGDGRSLDELRRIVDNGNTEPELRRQALWTLLAARPADLGAMLPSLLDDRVLALDALRGLAAYDRTDTPQLILQRLPKFPAEMRAAAIDTLVSRPNYAQALLEALEAKSLQPKEISALHARQILGLGDNELTKKFSAFWGEVRTTPAEKQSLIARHKSALSAEQLAEANLAEGRKLFQKSCANCHVLYGQGQKIGPDLTGSNRKNLDYLLENIVDPSAVVGADFRATSFVLGDGRVLNGVISEQNDRTVTVQTAQERITLDRNDIDTTKPTANSLMPDGLLQNLSEAQIRDMIAYLMSTDQVPLPEAQ